MRVVSRPDSEQMSVAVAEAVIGAVAAGARRLLLATGRSPMRVYELLAEAAAEGRFATDELTVVQLDEYWGLSRGDERRLDEWLERSVIAPWAIAENQVLRFDTTLEDPDEACERLEAEIARVGGLDLSLLGLGPNGHLGFNEPPSSPSSPTRPVTLSAESIESNGRYWGGPQRSPRRAVTVGLKTILASEQVMVVVSGAHKQDILRATLRPPPSPEVPASYLQDHPDTTVFADACAIGEPDPDSPPAPAG